MSAPDHRMAGPSPLFDGNPKSSSSLLRSHIRSLLSHDLTARQASARNLESRGAPASREIVRAILAPSFPRQAVPLCSTILERIGKASIPALTDALDSLEDPTTPSEAQRLGSLILALDPVADRTAAPCLMRQLKRITRLISSVSDIRMQAILDSSRVAVHTILSQLGDRRGANDLLNLLGDGRRRVRDGIVRSLSLVGDRRSLPPLARLHNIESEVSSSSAHLIRDTIRDITRRERITMRDPFFRKLPRNDRTSLEQILSRKLVAAHV